MSWEVMAEQGWTGGWALERPWVQSPMPTWNHPGRAGSLTGGVTHLRTRLPHWTPGPGAPWGQGASDPAKSLLETRILESYTRALTGTGTWEFMLLKARQMSLMFGKALQLDYKFWADLRSPSLTSVPVNLCDIGGDFGGGQRNMC